MDSIGWTLLSQWALELASVWVFCSWGWLSPAVHAGSGALASVGPGAWGSGSAMGTLALSVLAGDKGSGSPTAELSPPSGSSLTAWASWDSEGASSEVGLCESFSDDFWSIFSISKSLKGKEKKEKKIRTTAGMQHCIMYSKIKVTSLGLISSKKSRLFSDRKS